MRLSVLGALVLTFLALESISIPPPPSYIFDPVPVTEEGYWGDWSDVFST